MTDGAAIVRSIQRPLLRPSGPAAVVAGAPLQWHQARDFAAILRGGISDATLMYVGTSIGNAADEHVRLMDANWATAFPAYAIRNALYVATPPSAGAWAGAEMLNYTPAATLWEDNFNRADGAVGAATSGGTYATSTAFAIVSNELSQVSAANVLNPSAGLGTDRLIISARYKHGSETTTANGVRLHGRYTSTVDNITFALQHNGVILLSFQPGSVSLASLDTGPDLAAGEIVDVTLIVDGRWAYGEVVRSGTTYRICGWLTDAQHAALTGTKFAVTMPGTTYAGKRLDNLLVKAITEQRRLTVYNASVPGASITYHDGIFASSVLIETPDMVVIEMSHNEGSADTATFQSRLDTLIATIRGELPDVPITLLMENPQVSPATNATAHNARVASIPDYALANGLGHIDAYSSFPVGDINPDGIHPDAEGSGFIAGREKAAFGV
jgi:hypothetical protein